jgi:hypothetical protein
MTNHLEQARQRVASLKNQLAVAEQVVRLLECDPKALEFLGQTLPPAGEPATPPPVNDPTPRGPGRPTDPTRKIKGGPTAASQFVKIVRYLEGQGNKPQGIPTIACETGLKANAVINVVYRTHAACFQQAKIGKTTRIEWWLRDGWRSLVESEGAALPAIAAPRPHTSPSGKTNSDRVLAIIAQDWRSTGEIAKQTRLTAKQIRRVLAAKEVRDRIDRRRGDDGLLVYRLKEDEADDASAAAALNGAAH